ncbi:hypothetical protein AMATHDRAFT_86167 [Amanita thiersii Skay4041]|uniref:t-SNARE coiled-coil homology domain-containing protein n=1 Tax=Amanita thiersii Skay4041 TaxID=703135 RepID=A0A2A9NQ98_9AGAR|nr:hypothetical protein AMATHDRAFT_86167 [Amanita thiersii Skay4041]
MSTDPYHVVQQEIQASLQTGSQLLSSFVRIRSMARDDSEELMWARSELKATLVALEADLEALEESVKAVETTGASTFGLSNAEVQNRREYITYVQKELDVRSTPHASHSQPSALTLPLPFRKVQNMRAELNTTTATTTHKPPKQLSHPLERSRTATPTPPPPPYSHNQFARPNHDVTGGGGGGVREEDDQAAWAMEEQQMMIREQDRTMDHIAGTLNTLAQQAGLMGHEIIEHNELLTDIEQNVDRTDTKLNDAMRRMRKFVRDSEEKGSGYCIVFLIIVLMVLLLAVILV